MGWSIVLNRTPAHLFGVPQQPPQHDSLLAIIRVSDAQSFVWAPSLLPAGLASLYPRSCTSYNHAVGTTTIRVQTAAALEVLHVLPSIVRSSLPMTAEQVTSPLLLWCLAAHFPSLSDHRFLTYH